MSSVNSSRVIPTALKRLWSPRHPGPGWRDGRFVPTGTVRARIEGPPGQSMPRELVVRVWPSLELGCASGFLKAAGELVLRL
ncbi:MAG: hypothetical protein ACJ75H_02175 [Thermoanaerobaculia bacterium]